MGNLELILLPPPPFLFYSIKDYFLTMNVFSRHRNLKKESNSRWMRKYYFSALRYSRLPRSFLARNETLLLILAHGMFTLRCFVNIKQTSDLIYPALKKHCRICSVPI